MAFQGSPGETGMPKQTGRLKGTFKGLIDSSSYQKISISNAARRRMKEYTARQNANKIRNRLNNGF